MLCYQLMVVGEDRGKRVLQLCLQWLFSNFCFLAHLCLQDEGSLVSKLLKWQVTGGIDHQEAAWNGLSGLIKEPNP